MSHTTTMQTAFTDADAIKKTCQELGLPVPVQGTAELFDYSEHTGTIIRLPGWHYPVIIAADGTTKCDNYGGKWGAQSELNKFSQTYAKHVTITAMRKQGYMVQTTKKDNKLVLNFSK